MKTKILTGVDAYDLNKKQWDWQTTASPPVAITKQWPDEMLPRAVKPITGYKKIEAKDQFSRRIDYED